MKPWLISFGWLCLSAGLLICLALALPPSPAAQAAIPREPGVREPQVRTAWLRPETISVGGGYTCMVKNDAILACWGNNDAGQASPPSGTFIQVSAGERHTTCGVRSNGRLACWGNNDAGQASPPPGTFTQVSVGEAHTCAVKSNGSLTCWGKNDFGQASPPAGTFAQVSAGSWHTCAVRSNGSLTCWGKNDFGQASPPAGNFIQVSAGGNHTCGLKADGSLACWGLNGNGQASPPAGTFAQVSAGSWHTCAVKSDGTLDCWGLDFDGQTWFPPGTFTQVSAGYIQSCGLKADGTLGCWGLGAPELIVLPYDLPDGKPAVPYQQALSTIGGTAPYTYALLTGSLPPGLSLSPAGVLSGVPGKFGVFNFTVQVTDSWDVIPLSYERSFTIFIGHKLFIPRVLNGY